MFWGVHLAALSFSYLFHRDYSIIKSFPGFSSLQLHNISDSTHHKQGPSVLCSSKLLRGAGRKLYVPSKYKLKDVKWFFLLTHGWESKVFLKNFQLNTIYWAGTPSVLWSAPKHCLPSTNPNPWQHEGLQQREKGQLGRGGEGVGTNFQNGEPS